MVHPRVPLSSHRIPALAALILTVWSAVSGTPAALAQGGQGQGSKLTAETFSGLELRNIGPALMSGRIADIAIHPEDQSTWYIGVGSGGVWKTETAGTLWTPIFDEQDSYSIGALAIAPSRPDEIWVGTGENVDGRHVAFGDGVYRSRDGGATWENVGLENSGHIGKIVVHPADPETVWVAAKGPLWSGGGDRGVYKTTDGGKTWRLVLPGANQYTGANEVMIHPENPDVLWASMHQRLRTVAALVNGGPGSGIFKSTDGGETWREVTEGLPSEEMGRLGLAISPQRPDVVYATVELAHREGGFYRSTDGGESWEKRSDYLSGGTGPHYYQEIYASPHRFDRVYQMDVRLHYSEDGGKTWQRVNEEAKHGDNHALAFSPDDPDYLLAGSDGGLYESWDLGESWKFVSNLPITQFYKVAVDVDTPFYNIYGGTQDNNTQGGPSRTANVHGIRNSDWFVTLFGDGHQPATDWSNPDILYSEWQEGNIVRYDRTTGEIVYIQPQPEPGDPPERFNWDAPILVSSHDPARLYYASQRVWRSDDRGDSWRPVSGDLTRNVDRFTLPMMGRVQSSDAVWDLWAMSDYSTITSLAESPQDERILYAGTDDGLLQASEDGGATWREIPVGSLPGLPSTAFVNDVKADLHDADTVYAAFDNHKFGDFAPYLYKSTDRGRTWRSISDDLPDRHLVWRMVQDHERPELLFAATEFGIFFSIDGGRRWVELEGGVPTISFRDLAIQKRENDLVGASFGRGFFVFDDYTPLRHVTPEALDSEALFFPVKDAWWYVPRRTLGDETKASQGDAFYVAPNPPFGAVFTYYLKDGLETAEERRRAAERERAEAGEDTPYPGFEALEAERREEEPAIVFTVRDGAGQVVRRIEGPVSAGFHRVAWDLRYPAPEAITSPEEPGEEGGYLPEGGFLAAPGTYTVSLARRVGGVTTDLGLSESFEVVPMTEGTLPGASPAERTAFVQRLSEVTRTASGAAARLEELQTRAGSIARALGQSTVPLGSLDDRVAQLRDRLEDASIRLSGDPLRGDFGEPEVPSVQSRIGVVFLGNRWSLYGPTPTHERSLELAESGLSEIRGELSAVSSELQEIEDDLDAAGVPWTPGRSVPGGE